MQDKLTELAALEVQERNRWKCDAEAYGHTGKDLRMIRLCDACDAALARAEKAEAQVKLDAEEYEASRRELLEAWTREVMRLLGLLKRRGINQPLAAALAGCDEWQACAKQMQTERDVLAGALARMYSEKPYSEPEYWLQKAVWEVAKREGGGE